MSKTVILVCAHKQDACLKTPPYQPVQVGRAISQTELPFAVGDDTGDNISDRNRHYCELTAHYWAWKNLHDADYIGLNHYAPVCSTSRAVRLLAADGSLGSSSLASHLSRLRPPFQPLRYRHGHRPIRSYPYNLYTDYSKCKH